jgi:hypothetical protein
MCFLKVGTVPEESRVMLVPNVGTLPEVRAVFLLKVVTVPEESRVMFC